MLAYTGLETVANLAEETREPGVTLPRTLFAAIGASSSCHRADRRSSGSRRSRRVTARPTLGDEVAARAADRDRRGARRAPSGLARHVRARLRRPLGRAHPARGRDDLDLRLRPARLLPRRARTAAARIRAAAPAHARLALRDRRAAGDLARRSCSSTSLAERTPVTFLASLFSFGVLLAFTAAQLAVIRLRVQRAGPPRPFQVPLNVRVRGVRAAASVAHRRRRSPSPSGSSRWPRTRRRATAGPRGSLGGLVVYLFVRRGRGAGLLEHVVSTDEQVVPELTFTRILVPMKLGEIGEEMVATAVKLAQERNAVVEALNVVHVPLELAARRAADRRSSARASRSRRRGARRGPRRRGGDGDGPRPLDRRARSSRRRPSAAPT